MRIKFCLLFFIFSCFITFAQFEAGSYAINGYSLPFQVMFPENYNANQKYPLIVFLHGSGERGVDNQKQLIHGKQFFVDNFQSKHPAIVLAPQCPESDFWANVERINLKEKVIFEFGASNEVTESMETLIGLINYWLRSGLVDTKQVYIGGLSMGAMGTYELLWRMPNTFAAAFPICGGGDIPKVVENIKNTPLWIFHGDADVVVPVKLSRDLNNAIQKAGYEVKYSEYPGVNHNSWDNAFQEKDLASWLFSHKKQ